MDLHLYSYLTLILYSINYTINYNYLFYYIYSPNYIDLFESFELIQSIIDY